jgi:hypothetical protein
MDIMEGVSDMRVVLLAAAGLIAAAAFAAPAAAGGSAAAGFTGFTGVTVHHGSGFTSLQSLHRNRHRDGRRDGRRDRGYDAAYLYPPEYQGDSLWRAESYNDWWHERPWRAYPAWMTRNQNCERQYWSGGGWTC